MAKDIDKIAARLGARVVCQVPEVGGGAFGMARLAGIISALQARLRSGQGQQSNQSACAHWVLHPQVPMSEDTQRELERLAELVSKSGRQVSPMQLAAQLLEDAVEQLAEANGSTRE